MKLKKCLAILLAMVLTFSLAACGDSGDDTSKDDNKAASDDDKKDDDSDDNGGGSGEKIKVGFVVKSLADQYWILVKAGAEAEAAAQGVDLQFIAPNSESDVQKQVENIETLVASGIDVLCIAPSNDETVLPALQNAIDAGIKVIAVDTDTSLEAKESFIGTGNESAAKEGAKWAGEQIGENGTAIILRGRLGDATHDQREAGLEAGLKEAGIEILETQAADSEEEKGMSVTENLLQKYPDVDLVITTADSMAVGAYNAIKQTGAKAQVYGFDGTIPVCENVDKGEMLGTTAQSPYTMGVLGIQNAIALMNGETIDEVIDSGQEIVSKDNAADFVKDLEEKAGSAE